MHVHDKLHCVWFLGLLVTLQHKQMGRVQKPVWHLAVYGCEPATQGPMVQMWRRCPLWVEGGAKNLQHLMCGHRREGRHAAINGWLHMHQPPNSPGPLHRPLVVAGQSAATACRGCLCPLPCWSCNRLRERMINNRQLVVHTRQAQLDSSGTGTKLPALPSAASAVPSTACWCFGVGVCAGKHRIVAQRTAFWHSGVIVSANSRLLPAAAFGFAGLSACLLEASIRASKICKRMYVCATAKYRSECNVWPYLW